MTEKPGGFIWYELMTGDPDAAARFYGEVVGWTVSDPAPPELSGGLDYRMIVRSDGGFNGGVMRLTNEMAAEGARPMWAGYIHVADVDAAVAAITADGGTVLMPATDLPVGRMAYVADPQGASFYVMTPIAPPDQPDAQSDVFCEANPQHVRWNELNSADLDPAIAFYQKQFGWDQQGQMDMGPLGTYRFLQHGTVNFGAAMRMVEAQPMPMWIFYIGVDDIDRAAAAIKTSGGTILQGPDEIPGGEFSITALDPQGAVVGFVGPGKA